MKIKLSAKRIVLNIIIAVVSVALIIVGAGALYIDNMVGQINYEEVESGKTVQDIVESGTEDFNFGNISDGSLYHDDDVMNIVIMSLDNYEKKDGSNEGDPGRTDSMMLLTIDKKHNKIKLTSYMRDLYVQIPGYGFDRLNAAYSYGGPTLTMAAMENSFRVAIDRYVLIDYYAFRDVIDAIGGVDIEISQDEADVINAKSEEENADPVQAGVAHMTGRQARMYARIREIDSDFQRTARQRKVVQAVIDKIKNDDLLTINGYLSKILGMITTNMTKDEILGLASNITTYMNYDTESFRLPPDDAYTNYTTDSGAMVLLPYLQTCVDEFVKFIYEDDIPTLTEEYTLPQFGGVTVSPNATGAVDTTDIDKTYEDDTVSSDVSSTSTTETSATAETTDGEQFYDEQLGTTTN